MHDTLYDKAVEAIEKLFGDTSVDQTQTKNSLQALRDEIDIKLECLPDAE